MKPVRQITLTEAISGYEMAFDGRRLSRNTLASYQNAFNKLLTFLDEDPPLRSIKHETIQAFLAAQTAVSKATLYKYHTALSSLWTWAIKEKVVATHILHQVDRPKPEKRDIVPIPEADIRALLAAIEKSKTYKRPGKKESNNALPDALRNRAILLVLLDTGMRASELCDLQIHHCDLRNADKFITVRGGKGDKDRRIPISSRTATAVWRYLNTRTDARMNEPLFASDSGRRMDRNNLGNMLESLANRAGVPNIHPHRFRHTFAISFLRNGGDVYTLKAILGHESLVVCLTYLRIAQIDLDNAHRRASPVDHWTL